MITEQGDAYTGVDNLEVMQEAVRYTDFLVDLVRSGAPRGARTIDFGAGTGTFGARLRDELDVTCVESDEGLRDHLRAQGLAAVADLGALAAGTFDYLYSLNVLEHIDDDAAAARSWFEMLRPGGRLLVYVPAFDVLFGPMDRKVGHLRRYRRRSLGAVLQQAGFVVDRIEYADSLGYPASLAAKYVGRRDGGLNPRIIRAYDRVAFPISRGLDVVARHAFGKNVWARAHRP